MLLHLPRLLTPEALAAGRELLQRGRWVDGAGTAGPQARAVKNNRQLAADAPETAALQQLVLQALDASTLFFSAALPKSVLPPHFNRYGGAQNTYGNHVDQAVRYHPATRAPIRGDLSCTVFFSEPDSYDGGELVVEHSFGVERVKFAAGDAVLYPGSSVHRVEPVTRGERLAAFFWIQSLVRGDAERRVLFELDMALIGLRQRHGESAETVQLTGTYHNLLRLWAET